MANLTNYTETEEERYERILYKSIILGHCTTPEEDDFINSFY